MISHIYIPAPIKIYRRSILVAAALMGMVVCNSTVFAQSDVNLNSTKDSVYQVLYKKQTDNTLVSSIGYTKGDPLKAVPISSVNNTLAGRIAGLQVKQESGQPGNDYGTFSLRGVTPIVLVDGVPRNPNSVLPDHVESVTVLKDALAAAALGVRGGNGVILITTKKGNKALDVFNLDASFQTGITNPLKVRSILPADQYAMLYNEALKNDGRSPIFSQAAIDSYKNNSDPTLYPNNDWNSILLNDKAAYKRYSVNIEGASEKLRYFVATDYLTQDGIFKQSDINSYSTNADFSRFGFRGNLSFDLDEHLSVALNLYGSSQTRNTPGGNIGISFAPNTNTFTLTSGSVSSLFSSMLSTPANAYPIYNPDGSIGGNSLFANNIWGQLVHSGYSQNNNNDAFADLVVNRKMDDLLEGWWVKARASYSMEIAHSLFRNKNFSSFEMRIDPNSADTTYARFGPQSGLEQTNSSLVQTRNGSFFMDASTGIRRDFGAHHLDASLAYQFNSARFGSQIPFIIHNGILSANYDWNNRYLVELVASYSGNNWYKEGHRYNLYPAAGLGWNVHNESFFNTAIINKLKIRTSYGLVGTIDANYFSYLYTYSNYGGAYIIGTGIGGVQGSAESQLPYIRTTQKALKFNVGADLSLLQDRWSINLDYYRNNHFDNLVVRGNSTGILGMQYPAENLGKTRYSGVEINTGWSDRINNLNYFIGGNIAFQQSEIIENAQLTQPYQWLERRGQPVDQFYGYTAEGFVTAAGEGAVVDGYLSQPGDIKYKDLNGDGIINYNDVSAIGNNKSKIYFGLNARLQFKGFDLNILFQGTKNREALLTGAGEWEFQSNGIGSAFEQHLDRWTPATATTATYPRLTAGVNINNHTTSTFWLKPVDYIRLKTAEMGYTFRGSAISKVGLSQIRVFTTAYNLFTFSSVKRIDPESFSYDSPLMRMFNAGVSLKF